MDAFLKKWFSPERAPVVLAVLACAVPLAFALFTGQIWEDFFITFKFSKNLCDGHGLVYTPGERVHGFTSPLGVLLPAVCYALTGCRSYVPALWLFRILFCAPAFAFGGYLLFRTFSREGKAGHAGALAVTVFYILEAKSVLFSMNGMETAFMLMFFAWALSLAVEGISRRWRTTGLIWAGLMWTRPDSCVYIAVLAAAALIFSDCPRGETVKGIAKAALITTVVYLPWFVWAWVYYGTPVPHTITAKSGTLEAIGLVEILFRTLTRIPGTLALIFAPPYVDFSSWPVYVRVFSHLLGWLCAGYWVFCPRTDRLGRLASFCFFALSLYTASIPFIYPWYLPPIAMAGLVTIVRAFSQLAARLASTSAPSRPWFVYLTVILGLYMGSLISLEAVSKRIHQRLIDDGTRRQVGLWLRDHAAEGDRVYLECLGYIGYFSECQMLDYPGLATPQVARLVREEGHDFVSLVEKLQPEWLVLRMYEVSRMEKLAYFRENYIPASVFDTRPALAEWIRLPGCTMFFDAHFVVFRHRSTTEEPGSSTRDGAADGETNGPLDR